MRADCGERCRIATAKLQRDRMFGGIKAQQPRAIAVQDRAGSDHFSIDQRAPRQQTMEEPAVPISPFHHRSDTETPIHRE